MHALASVLSDNWARMIVAALAVGLAFAFVRGVVGFALPGSDVWFAYLTAPICIALGVYMGRRFAAQ